ncbi:MAG: L,D-transpeptidase scaffold domain-containing protein, partial [Burkholderiaceae bacterium]
MRCIRWITAALVALLAQGLSLAAEPLLWFDGARLSPQAEQAVALLADATSHGLEPVEYDADRLAREVDRARGGGLDPTALAALDRRLTAAMERYLM